MRQQGLRVRLARPSAAGMPQSSLQGWIYGVSRQPYPQTHYRLRQAINFFSQTALIRLVETGYAVFSNCANSIQLGLPPCRLGSAVFLWKPIA